MLPTLMPSKKTLEELHLVWLKNGRLHMILRTTMLRIIRVKFESTKLLRMVWQRIILGYLQLFFKWEFGMSSPICFESTLDINIHKLYLLKLDQNAMIVSWSKSWLPDQSPCRFGTAKPWVKSEFLSSRHSRDPGKPLLGRQNPWEISDQDNRSEMARKNIAKTNR